MGITKKMDLKIKILRILNEILNFMHLICQPKKKKRCKCNIDCKSKKNPLHIAK